MEPFAVLAARPEPQLDELALALAGELREVDAAGALTQLDRLAAEVDSIPAATPAEEAGALAEVLGRRHGFVGDREDYDHPEILLDPFGGGVLLEAPPSSELRAWGPHETALRMLNNLVGSYLHRADLGRAIGAAEMRLELPLGEAQGVALGAELRALRARLN